MTATWSQSKVYDAWLECEEGDVWVRYSEIKAIEVAPRAMPKKGQEDDYIVIFVMERMRYIYRALKSRDAARGAVTDLLRNLSNDWNN
ncbi:MAG TPA: hypothetical protein VFI41_04780 [Gemmatimonadales bacterium]|nr:hypothetical protein [Gemmatimonadales bacterium]